MKLMIAADIHGSAQFCQALLDRYAAEGAERLVLLGDLLYHGPRNPLPDGYDPMAVAGMLNRMGNCLLCVRGNCDAEVDQMVLAFPMMADSLLLEAGGRRVLATHGHIWGPDRLPPHQQGDILLCGHTHVPALRPVGGMLYLNPGSVSLPKENSARGYLLMEDSCVTRKTLSGGTLDQLKL